MSTSTRAFAQPFLAAAIAVLALLPLTTVAAEPVIDYLGIPGPIRFGSTDYKLAWSSNPSPELIKQEYLPAGQNVDRYESMVLVDMRPVGGNAEQAATGMAEQLKARKKTDPVTNYDMMVSKSGDEALLDFVISSTDAKQGLVIEWNGYRYVTGGGGRGTALFGISRRAYGDTAARALLTALKDTRTRDMDTLAKLPIRELSAPTP